MAKRKPGQQAAEPAVAASLPAFAAAARLTGVSILAFWEGDTTWRVARWVAKAGITPHWGVDGNWTPGPDPVAFAEMPPLPGSTIPQEDALPEGDQGAADIAASEQQPPRLVHVLLRSRVGGKTSIEGVYADLGDACRVAKRMGDEEFARTQRLRASPQVVFSVVSETLWQYEATAAAAPCREAQLEAALRSLLGALDEPCRLDHHGNCQSHFIESPCRVDSARALLACTPTGIPPAKVESRP